jgi:hypothetical protein
MYVAGSSGPCSRALASLGSRDSEPTAAAGQFSGKQQQQVFVFFMIENVGEMNGNESFFFLLHLPELCVKLIASWKLSVPEMIIQSGLSPISLWAGSLINMYAKCGECSTRCPYTMQ